MKTLTRTLQTVVAAVIILAVPQVAWALGSSAFVVNPQVSGSQSLGSTTVGAAYSTNFNVQLQMGSTVYKGGGVTFEQLTVSPASAQITATITNSGPFKSTQSTGTWTTNTTLTVSATASAVPGTYTVTFTAASTNDANINPGVTGTPNIGPPTGNPVTNKYTFTVGTPVTPVIIWSPAGVDTNWSNANNWNTAATPGSTNDVYFFDLGATNAGIVNNVVDTNMSIGSLSFANTNNFHTTLIQSNVTLTVGGDAIGLIAGTGTDPGPASSPFGYTTSNSITGAGGTLSITNPNAIVFVAQTHVTQNNAISSASAALDLSGLDAFRATVAGVQVGSDLLTASKGQSGVLNLAKTNTIIVTPGSTAPQIDVGDNNQSGDTPTIQSRLLLGQTNGIYADSITVGRGKTDADPDGALMAFNSVFSSPTAYFRGTGGASSRVGTWMIGDGGAGRTYYAYGTCDFSLGTVNALVDTMYIGKGATGSSPQDAGYGTLTFNAGTIDVNTLEVGYTTIGPGIGADTGTVNVNGGSLVVNTFLELAHGNNSLGTLNISSATLTANNGITPDVGTSAISLTGSTLNATNSTATLGTLANPITTFSIANSTLNLAVPNSAPSVSAVTLNAGGTASPINISSITPPPPSYPYQYPIIKYSSSSGDLSTFGIGTLPGTYTGYISNNSANSSIDVVITNGPVPPYVYWTGATDSNWDTGTVNWKLGSGTPAAYVQNDYATFDDTLTGTTNVNLTTVLTPGGVFVNNTLSNYVFTGTGRLSGSAFLEKSGSGTLILSETGGDDFSGGVVVNDGLVILATVNSAVSGGTKINSGTVQVGNNGAMGTLPSGDVTDNGVLVFSRTDNITVPNAISGAGRLTQNNTDILTLTGDNSAFAGAAIVAQGTLQIGNTNAVFVAANGITVSNGATLDTDGQALYGGSSALTVTVSGAGVGGNGAIVNNSAKSPNQVLHVVTLTGDTWFGGVSSWDIRNSSGNTAPADAYLNGAYNLTKVGTNTVTLRGVNIDPGLGDINVRAGELHITATATAPLSSLGNSSATATVSSNATLTLDTIGIVPGKNLVLTNGGTLACSDTNLVGSPVTLSGAANNTISVGTSGQLTITNIIGGTGGFSKNGSGPLFLTASNNYSGDTVVSGGTLALYGGGSDGSISSSANLDITAGATIDVSGRSDGTLTLASGQTLNGGVNGSGAINGILVASSGSLVAPGTGTTNIGTLTVSGSATLQGTTVMSLNAANGINDRLAANGIAYGGTLIVTNVSGVITNGQSFQLFASSGGYSGTFGGGVALPTASGLTWTNTLGVDGKITAGVIPPAQPTITSISLAGTSLVISGTGGTLTYQFVVLNSTNVALPLNQWTPLVTNPFTGSNFSVTNTVDPSAPQNFYFLRVQ